MRLILIVMILTTPGVSLQGFDFAFMRRSRLYDECTKQTNYKWDTQYVGGKTLAVCNGKASSSAAHVLLLAVQRITLILGFFFFSISRSISSNFRSKDGVLSKESQLSDNQEQQPTAPRSPQHFCQGAEASGRARRTAAGLPRVWRTMRQKLA